MSNLDDDSLCAIDWGRADHLIELALNEDLDMTGDTTTLAVVPEQAVSRAVLLCKEKEMVVAGLPIAERVFKIVEPMLEFDAKVDEGEVCHYGDILAVIKGPARGILTAERTALNFLQRLCGVASASYRYSKELEGSKTVVLDILWQFSDLCFDSCHILSGC